MWIKYLIAFADLVFGILIGCACTEIDFVNEKNVLILVVILSTLFLASAFLLWR